jgi:hypothetical protein
VAGNEKIEEILAKDAKGIVTGMTFAVKEVGGSYARRPVEEIYEISDAYFRAHKTFLMKGHFQPLVDFAEKISRRRAKDRFRLHELMRAAYSFKKVVYPVFFEACWEDRNDLIKSLMMVDKATDRFVVNLSQVFMHYAKDYLLKDPLEFPVWVSPSSDVGAAKHS